MVQVTFKEFTTLTDSKGQFKTWGDIKDGGYLATLVNSEILGNVYRAPVSVVGDNIKFEYTTFTPGQEFNDASVSKAPTLNRALYVMPEKYLEFEYAISLFGKMQALEWAMYLGRKDANIMKQINDQNNITALKAIHDYALATGQVKVVTNLGTAGKAADLYMKDVALISYSATSVWTQRTAVNLGLEPSRINILVSPFAMQNITTGIAAINVSQGAFATIKSGEINNLYGFNWKPSMYLQNAQEQIPGYGVDLTKTIGIVYNVDTLGFYQHAVQVVNFPAAKSKITRSFSWKPFAAMIPSYEHTTFIVRTEFPTITEVNAARTALASAQPGVYGNAATPLPGGLATTMTSDEYTALKAKATDFQSPFTPNVKTA